MQTVGGIVQRLLIVNGMKRSGTHAIVNWLLPQSCFLFFNNILPVARILEGKSGIPQPVEFEKWRNSQVRRFKTKSREIRTSDLIVSLEDHRLDLRFFASLPSRTTNVLIVREAENLFASRIRKAFSIDHPAYPKEYNSRLVRAIELWKQHAREYLGLTTMLDSKVCISYDLWFASKSYRRTISNEMQLGFTDQNFSMVPEAGGGSSFDQLKFDGQNELMSVLDRKNDLEDRERDLLSRVMDDLELRDLNNAILATHRR